MADFAWNKTVEELIVEKTGTIPFPPANTHAMAKVIGTARHEMNKITGLNRYGSFANRDEEGSLIQNILGAEGELLGQQLFRYYLIPFSHSVLLSFYPDPTPDIITEKHSFDAKGIGNGRDLLANEKIFDASQASHYLFIQIKTLRYWIFSHKEISTWPKKDVVRNESKNEGSSMAYFREICDVK